MVISLYSGFRGFLQSEGRNPTLQTLVRASARKVDHLFSGENKNYEIVVNELSPESAGMPW